MRDPLREGIYFTLDFWDSETDYQNFQKKNGEPYAEIDRETESLTVSERLIASFPVAENS